MISEVTASDKFKMAAAKPEIHLSQLVVMLQSKLKKQLLCFKDAQPNSTKEDADVVRCKRQPEIQHGGR